MRYGLLLMILQVTKILQRTQVEEVADFGGNGARELVIGES